jgi:cytochrome b561
MPGLGAPTATEPPPGYVRRFSGPEQSLHWLLAISFFVMLATGLILYLPSLAEVAAQRQLWKSIHLGAALGFWVGLLLIWSSTASTQTTVPGWPGLSRVAARSRRRAASTPARS